MTKDEKISAYLKSEEGQRNGKRFIKALKERRIICSVKHVSNSGMSRAIAVREVVKLKELNQYAIYQFDWFIRNLGWTYVDSDNAIRVSGCGMNMVFHLLYCVCGRLEHEGFKLPDNWSSLCDNYLSI